MQCRVASVSGWSGPKGEAKTLTGYTDAYAIEQAISEARRVK